MKQFQGLYYILKTDRSFSDLPGLKKLGGLWGVPEFEEQKGNYGDYDSSYSYNEMIDVCINFIFAVYSES